MMHRLRTEGITGFKAFPELLTLHAAYRYQGPEAGAN